MVKGFFKTLALMLAVVLCLSGCGMITVDPEMDAAEKAAAQAEDDAIIVAEFDGGTVTKGVAMEEYEAMASMYASYGFELTDEETITSVKQELLDYLVEDAVAKAKAEEMGLTELSDEEMEEINTQAQADYDEMVELYMTYFDGDTEEEIKANTIEYLDESGYTLDYVRDYAIENAWREKLNDQITADVTVTDEALQEAYETRVAEDEENFTTEPGNFETAVLYGDTVAWIPEGYRTVKHVLIALTDEQSEELSNLEFELEDVNYQLEELGDEEPVEETAAQDAVDETVTDETVTDETVTDDTAAAEAAADDAADAAAEEVEMASDEDADTVVDDTAGTTDASGEDAAPTREELLAQQADLTAQIEALKEQIKAELMPKAEEVIEKANAGEDFDALIEEYGEDPGMEYEPSKSEGYYVSVDSTMWDPAFQEAAMALENVGDISEPVLSSSGLHIIRYEADVVSGAVAFEELRDELEETVLEELKTQKYDETVAEWVEAANVKTYVDRMN